MSGGKDLRQAVLDALSFSSRIVLAREEVVPRFMIETTDGGVTLFVPLPDALAERERRMRLVGGYMAWTGAARFIFSTELVEPDAVLAVGVAPDEVLTAARLIRRQPLSLGTIEWLERDAVGEEIIALLPQRISALDAGLVAELERAFGPGGEFRIERRH